MHAEFLTLIFFIKLDAVYVKISSINQHQLFFKYFLLIKDTKVKIT